MNERKKPTLRRYDFERPHINILTDDEPVNNSNYEICEYLTETVFRIIESNCRIVSFLANEPDNAPKIECAKYVTIEIDREFDGKTYVEYIPCKKYECEYDYSNNKYPISSFRSIGLIYTGKDKPSQLVEAIIRFHIPENYDKSIKYSVRRQLAHELAFVKSDHRLNLTSDMKYTLNAEHFNSNVEFAMIDEPDEVNKFIHRLFVSDEIENLPDTVYDEIKASPEEFINDYNISDGCISIEQFSNMDFMKTYNELKMTWDDLVTNDCRLLCNRICKYLNYLAASGNEIYADVVLCLVESRLSYILRRICKEIRRYIDENVHNIVYIIPSASNCWKNIAVKGKNHGGLTKSIIVTIRDTKN